VPGCLPKYLQPSCLSLEQCLDHACDQCSLQISVEPSVAGAHFLPPLNYLPECDAFGTSGSQLPEPLPLSSAFVSFGLPTSRPNDIFHISRVLLLKGPSISMEALHRTSSITTATPDTLLERHLVIYEHSPRPVRPVIGLASRRVFLSRCRLYAAHCC
jgi:hypothetical protein